MGQSSICANLRRMREEREYGEGRASGGLVHGSGLVPGLT